MPGPKATQIDVTPRQGANLAQIVRKATSKQMHVTRAKIILLAGEGQSNSQISRALGIHRETVCSWRKRWAEAAASLAVAEAKMEAKEWSAFLLAFLSDLPRCGSPGKFSAKQVCRIVALACEPPGEYGRPVTHWTPEELADEAAKQGIVTRISARQAGRFLKRSRTQTASVSVLAPE